MFDLKLPDLTFPELTYGENETPWDLRRLLYRGGSEVNIKGADQMINAGDLGLPLVERIELVRQMHEAIANAIGRGGQRTTAEGRIDGLRTFFRWADRTMSPLNMETVESSYLDWTDSLLQRARLTDGYSEGSAYYAGSRVGWVLNCVLCRSKPIIKITRLQRPKTCRRAVSTKADKQNLEDTFAFGHFLLDIADGLSLEAVRGALPVCINLRNGKLLEEWSGLKNPKTRKAPNPKYPNQTKYLARKSLAVRAVYAADRSLRTRYPLFNLRMTAEMFMLMGQPGINLAQVHQVRMDQWRFKPSTNGYEVRTYKHRRWGPVVFEIYSEHRAILDRYLKWRAAIFPDDPDGLLFPLIGYGRAIETPPQFDMIKRRCQRAGIKYLSPTALRSTNVNWMLRRTNDPGLTAAEKQHSAKMLIGVYEKPSQQRAMVQIKAYWAKHDPAQAAAGPGSCIGKSPESIPGIPLAATKPDCQTPAGCLFCAHLRDIDSLDHVWALVSYRLFKSFELGGSKQPESKKELPQHPAELAIDRLTFKLKFIRESNVKREAWVKEALLRIEEGRYHPDWAKMIDASQVRSNSFEA